MINKIDNFIMVVRNKRLKKKINNNIMFIKTERIPMMDITNYQQ